MPGPPGLCEMVNVFDQILPVIFDQKRYFALQSVSAQVYLLIFSIGSIFFNINAVHVHACAFIRILKSLAQLLLCLSVLYGNCQFEAWPARCLLGQHLLPI